ncbi:hypothetical protein RJT34_12282 [Clitoria ternatea]|uniref:DUF8003 domain-containing protein n=1 Tax=Clitoria ternatea TaxID=43366 RepID=A0AAN9JLU8_CLITE
MVEELLMSDSEIKIYGALRMSVKIHLMLNSKMLIDGNGDSIIATSLLEASNLVVLKDSSVIHSNANLGIHGQGCLNLSGPGNLIEAQRLVLSLFYSIKVDRERSGEGHGLAGKNGPISAIACPRGLYGIFCKECPVGTYKNVSGSDRALCHHCPPQGLPHRALYIPVQGVMYGNDGEVYIADSYNHKWHQME